MARKFKDRQWDGELSELPVFADCSARTMRRLSNLGTRVQVRAQQHLTTAGNRGAEVLIVLSGTATCLVGGVEEARFEPGDFFGEVATLDGGARTATVVASTDMDVLVLNSDGPSTSAGQCQGGGLNPRWGTASTGGRSVVVTLRSRRRHAAVTGRP